MIGLPVWRFLTGWLHNLLSPHSHTCMRWVHNTECCHVSWLTQWTTTTAYIISSWYIVLMTSIAKGCISASMKHSKRLVFTLLLSEHCCGTIHLSYTAPHCDSIGQLVFVGLFSVLWMFKLKEVHAAWPLEIGCELFQTGIVSSPLPAGSLCPSQRKCTVLVVCTGLDSVNWSEVRHKGNPVFQGKLPYFDPKISFF